MTSLELDEMLTLRWPGVVRRVMGDLDANDFVRGFVRSIAKHGKRPNWQPTAKQEAIMRRLLTEYSGPQDPEFNPIEGD
ncbi:hypothetical protein [Paenirhodobacter populi]|uniref:Uncharacterized protein n=1 Tax=Paenirhodobacter populi TaxID=2306993 RepID=A0A443J1H0_9RHOB|nr:hypothetical protein [Sinirhodobacter populi]RWR14314.1 hypothetical protein D2T33_03630 [Sinirhodobacter populi]